MWRLPAKVFTAVCLASIALSAHPALAEANEAAPTSVKATYQVYKAGILIGTIDERFTREGEHYKIVSATETAGPLRLFLCIRYRHKILPGLKIIDWINHE